MTTKKEAPEDRSGPTLRGEHDITDHPAIQSGTFRNVGDTVINRDPNAPSSRRPEIEEAQYTGERKTTTHDPAKKTVKPAARGDGAGPES